MEDSVHAKTSFLKGLRKVNYPVKHLLATALLGPVFYAIYDPSDFYGTKIWDMYLIYFISGLLFSLPTFFFYYLIYRGLYTLSWRPLYKKLILNMVAIFGVFLTLKIIQGSMIDSLIVTYSLTLILTSLFIKMPVGENAKPIILSYPPASEVNTKGDNFSAPN